MVIAGVVIETHPGKAPEVAVRLAASGEVRVEGGDGDRRLAVVVSAATGAELERWAEALLRSDAAILGVFPTFVGQDGADPQQEAAASGRWSVPQ
jgi:nitrate reductase NapAB chaperone NapD